MEFFILGLLVLIAVGGFVWLRKRRRELTPVEDDWAGITGTAGRSNEVLSRDALVGRSHDFDPGAWDDSPDPDSEAATSAKPAAVTRPGVPRPSGEAAEPDDGDAEPTHLDRDFLRSRARKDAPLEWPED